MSYGTYNNVICTVTITNIIDVKIYSFPHVFSKREGEGNIFVITREMFGFDKNKLTTERDVIANTVKNTRACETKIIIGTRK